MDEMLEAEVWSVTQINRNNAVLLRPLGSEMVVPIFIGHPEVHAIILGMGDAKVKRPLTCDVLLTILRRLGLILFRVEIYEIRNDIFYARLLLAGREFSEARPLVIDSRPSDALALAIREKCAVYVSPQVLDQTGIPAEIFIEGAVAPAGMEGPLEPPPASGPAESGSPGGDPGRRLPAEGPAGEPFGDGKTAAGEPRGDLDSLAARRRRLQADLEEAVEKEAYEQAAEIRDLLILLDQQLEQERRGRGAV
jgi:bifunctional DNase/RNase